MSKKSFLARCEESNEELDNANECEDIQGYRKLINKIKNYDGSGYL